MFTRVLVGCLLLPSVVFSCRLVAVSGVVLICLITCCAACNYLFYRWKKWVSSGKADKIPLKEDDKDLIEQLQLKLQQATKKKETAVSNEDRLTAASLLDDAKAAIKNVRFANSHVLFCYFCAQFYGPNRLFLYHTIGPKASVRREAHV
jgi:hypothetical protein